MLEEQLMQIVAGTPVYHKVNPGRMGVLTGRTLQAMFLMAEVNWGNQFEFVDSTQLVEVDTKTPRDTDSEVREGRYGTVDDLRRRMTFEKLRGLITDVFYSMKTSEIDFYGHQFKPVLRFTESATNRLLIADEVGLGKTIEAGLIWTEWQARQKARRLLVVCPPTLCPKWLRELQDRFQLAAEMTDAEHLADLLERFDRNGPGLSFLLVASYNALRPNRKERAVIENLSAADKSEGLGHLSSRVRLLSRLNDWEQADRFLDMVVFDEMHCMKETGTANNFLGEILTSAAASMVGLSATPIHNKSRDLYALLRLVDPDVFRDERGFDDLRNQNVPIVRIQNELLRTNINKGELDLLISEVQPLESQIKIREALDRFDGTPQSRVEVRHLVEKMNLLGNFINRTRKRDVFENRVLRVPVTFPVNLTEEEFAFYQAVLGLVRKEIADRGERVTSFHLLHPALRMSSSLPAVADAVRDGKWGGFDEMENLADDFSFEYGVEAEQRLPSFDTLKHLTRYDFEKNDSKYRALRNALKLITSNGALRDDNNRVVTIQATDKIIIFAFFKSTIAYLKQRLETDGFKVVAVTGDIRDRFERDKTFQRFASDDNRILLCSEIGAEGLDLQFARILINYDLPWNPMRVEQRIGRIDRIGQEAHSIVIINFHVRDTIDGSIYNHLYRKIGLFESTIGSLEGILGEEISKFTSMIFREDLTPQQIEARAEQTAFAVRQRAQIEEQLESSTGALVAFQDLLSDQIGESQRLGRFVKPSELRLHAEDFFSGKYKGRDACLLTWDNPALHCVEIKMSFAALSDFESFCQVQEYAWPDGFSRTNRTASITFDPSVHQQLRRKHRNVVLVTHLHPLFRWITKRNEEDNNKWHKVSAVRIESDEFEKGRYFYLIYRMTMEGITRKDAFYYATRNIENQEVLTGPRAEGLINLALDKGRSAFLRDAPNYVDDLVQLRESLSKELQTAQRMFREDQSQKLNIRRQQVSAHYDRLIEVQERRIATVEQSSLDNQRGVLGFKRQLENLAAQRDLQLTKLRERSENLREVPSEVACGILEIIACLKNS